MSVFYKLSPEQLALAEHLRKNPIQGVRVTAKGGVCRCSKAVWRKIKGGEV